MTICIYLAQGVPHSCGVNGEKTKKMSRAIRSNKGRRKLNGIGDQGEKELETGVGARRLESVCYPMNGIKLGGH